MKKATIITTVAALTAILTWAGVSLETLISVLVWIWSRSVSVALWFLEGWIHVILGVLLCITISRSWKQIEPASLPKLSPRRQAVLVFGVAVGRDTAGFQCPDMPR